MSEKRFAHNRFVGLYAHMSYVGERNGSLCYYFVAFVNKNDSQCSMRTFFAWYYFRKAEGNLRNRLSFLGSGRYTTQYTNRHSHKISITAVLKTILLSVALLYLLQSPSCCVCDKDTQHRHISSKRKLYYGPHTRISLSVSAVAYMG